MISVRCRVCHREERWSGEAREVVVEGGARRPRTHPELAAWRTLVASHTGQLGPVVAACAACGQPMVADQEVAAIEWQIRTPEGSVCVKRHGLRGPQGPLDWAEATALVERHYPEEWGVADYVGPGALARSGLVLLMLAPVALWVLATGAIVVILLNAGR